MNKPEKKEYLLKDVPPHLMNIEYDKSRGYNQACDDWEKYITEEFGEHSITYCRIFHEKRCQCCNDE